MSKPEEKTKTPEEMSREEIAAEMAKGEPAEPETPPEPEKQDAATAEEFMHTAADGTVYKAKSQEELYKIVTKALDDNKTAYHGAIKTIEQLQPKKEPSPEVFNANTYYEKLAADPLAAKRYLDSFDDESRAAREYVTAQREKEARESAVRQFYADVPDYAKVETQESNDAFRARMAEAGRSITVENLKATYLELLLAGKIPSVAAEPPTQRKAPPPTPSGGGRAARSELSEIEKAEQMTREELRAYIEKKGREHADALN